jgi:hypothetical protein
MWATTYFTGSLPCLEGGMGKNSIAGVDRSFTSITTLASNAIWGETLDPLAEFYASGL